jgi:plasmid stability protein
MANLTITIDPEVLKRARIRAIRENTSVNAVLRDQLERYAAAEQDRPRPRPIDGFLELARQGGFASGAEGRTWTRDELYDE